MPLNTELFVQTYGRGLRIVLDTPYVCDFSLHDAIKDARKNPTPHVVHYDSRGVTYANPQHFYLHMEDSPSDCTWIVPGTLQDTSDL